MKRRTVGALAALLWVGCRSPHPAPPSLTPVQKAALEESAQAAFVQLQQAPVALRAKRRGQLSEVLERLDFPAVAFGLRASTVTKEAALPLLAENLEALFRLEARLGRPGMVGALVDPVYDAERLSRLPPRVLDRIHLELAMRQNRRGKLSEAASFLAAVPAHSLLRAKAVLLGALFAADPRYAIQRPQVLARLGQVARMNDPRQEELEEVHRVAALTRARILYSIGTYRQAAEAYALLASSSKDADRVRFEGALALGQAGEVDRAVLLLHAPEVQNSFLPEALSAEATLLQLAGRPEKALAAALAFEPYRALSAPLQALLSLPPQTLLGLWQDQKAHPLAPGLRRALEADPPLRRTLFLLEVLAREERLLSARPGWADRPLGAELRQVAQAERTRWESVAGGLMLSRLQHLERSLRTTALQVETAAVEAEVALAARTLEAAALAAPLERLSRLLPTLEAGSDEHQEGLLRLATLWRERGERLSRANASAWEVKAANDEASRAWDVLLQISPGDAAARLSRLATVVSPSLNRPVRARAYLSKLARDYPAPFWLDAEVQLPVAPSVVVR